MVDDGVADFGMRWKSVLLIFVILMRHIVEEKRTSMGLKSWNNRATDETGSKLTKSGLAAALLMSLVSLSTDIPGFRCSE